MISPRANVIETINASVTRGRGLILRDINLKLAAGETVAVMGPNGVGKSTLLGCLAGTLRPTTGEIRRFSHAASRPPAANRDTGYLGHENALYPELTAVENLVFAARMYLLSDPTHLADARLASCGLARFRNCRVAQLSQGARRRLAILRATIHEPRLLLLDEPFASLDSDGSEWLESQFREWRRCCCTVCFVSHDADQAQRLADRTIHLAAGQVLNIPSDNEIACSAA